MFGCFRRLITLVILAIVAVAAFVTRDSWLPKVRSIIGAPAATARADSTTLAAPADTGWTALTYQAAERGRKALARLTNARGPAYVNLSAAEFAGTVLDSLTAQLPPSAESLQVRTAGNELQVRASVRLGDLGGRAVLGPLASMMGDRERLTLGGTLEPTGIAGVAQYKLVRMRVGSFDIPSPLVPRLVRSLKGRAAHPGVDVSALPIRLPAGVGDIRAAQGRITLYRLTQ
ncbi:MAG: hypothetical protein H7305_08475 [Gemmatimonadaceae bacterium]|nr:hypothetical protein [Gemmatimonadaceae bacterium]